MLLTCPIPMPTESSKVFPIYLSDTLSLSPVLLTPDAGYKASSTKSVWISLHLVLGRGSEIPPRHRCHLVNDADA